MKKMMFFKVAVASIFLAGSLCQAQEPVIYPAKGQSQEQLEKDKYECYTWAKQQSGFDPMQQSAATAAPAQQGGVVRGGARGALLGVTAGAIAGDAGKGAGIGAAVGALGGGMKQRDRQRQQDQAQQQQAAAYAQSRDGYNRAQSACLEGRGYSVK